ncbi:MAG: iron chelate uptake ABC transporter family permease subunit [Parvibaculaceae bacterium]|nr:iron chelate uptake ABC transporter family permease subunit [Parvibaculaceae bacterium]
MFKLYLSIVLSILVLSLISVSIGAADFDLALLFSDSHTQTLLFASRLPRTFAALLTGASMAVAGVIVQLLVQNKFVEPGTTGASEAAILGLVIVTVLLPGFSIIGKILISTLAALIGMAGFLLLIQRLPRDQPLLIPLVGLIYSGIIQAGAVFIAYQTDLLQYLGVWLNGEFSGAIAGRYELLWLAGGASLFAYIAADQFTIVGLGRSASINLGLKYNQVMTLGLITVSMVTALVVTTVGVLPFVGLVVPNIVSRLMGDNLRRSLPIVAALGASLVLTADIVGRVVRFPYEIPAGTIFGAAGAAIFLWLLLKPAPHAQ